MSVNSLGFPLTWQSTHFFPSFLAYSGLAWPSGTITAQNAAITRIPRTFFIKHPPFGVFEARSQSGYSLTDVPEKSNLSSPRHQVTKKNILSGLAWCPGV